MNLNSQSVIELRETHINHMADLYEVPRHAARSIAACLDPVLRRKAFIRELRDASLVYASATSATIHNPETVGALRNVSVSQALSSGQVSQEPGRDFAQHPAGCLGSGGKTESLRQMEPAACFAGTDHDNSSDII